MPVTNRGCIIHSPGCTPVPGIAPRAFVVCVCVCVVSEQYRHAKVSRGAERMRFTSKLARLQRGYIAVYTRERERERERIRPLDDDVMRATRNTVRQ